MDKIWEKLYDDFKRSPAIAAIFCILGFGLGWLANDQFLKAADKVKIGSNSFIPKSELDKYVLVADCKNYSEKIENKLAGDLSEYQKAYTGLDAQNKELLKQRDYYYSNCSILGKINELESRKEQIEHEMRDLATPGLNGNPGSGMSANNSIIYNQRQRQVNEYQTRIAALQSQLNK